MRNVLSWSAVAALVGACTMSDDPSTSTTTDEVQSCSSDALGAECSLAAAEALIALRSAFYAMNWGSHIVTAIGAGAGIPAAVTTACAPSFEMSCIGLHLGIEGTCELATHLSQHAGPGAFASVLTACTAFRVGLAGGRCLGEALACMWYPPDQYDQPIDPNNCVAGDGSPRRPSVMACAGGVAQSPGTIATDCRNVVNGYGISDPNVEANCIASCVAATSVSVQANCPRDPQPAPQPLQPVAVPAPEE